jgi:regulator of sigma E protease
MYIIIFIIILAVLVLVHEFGHFLIAKLSGIRVDEFGLGFPPRLVGWKPKGGETTYTLNAIPFGGFVKIFGEDGVERSPEAKRSFPAQSAWIQIAVLAGGIFFNLLFAWVVISFSFMIGLPVPTDYMPGATLANVQTTITTVDSGSPAAAAGLRSGDQILGIGATGAATAVQSSAPTITDIQQFTAAHNGAPIFVLYKRGAMTATLKITPAFNPSVNRATIGVTLDSIGILRLSFFSALWHGLTLTASLIQETAVGLWQFIGQALVGQANLGAVAGPVGIAGLVGDATALGFVYVLSFTAFISINLAIINLIPFPALDGGRILFVIIEKIKGSPIPARIGNTINTAGFAILIALMVLVTYHDIIGLIH